MNAISIENLEYYLNYFTKLDKAQLDYEIQKNEQYIAATTGSYYNIGFHAYFKNVRTMDRLALIWKNTEAAISLNFIQSFTEFENLQKMPQAMRVNGDLYKKNNASIKFYAKNVFDDVDFPKIYLIDKPVSEVTIAGHPIRTCIAGTSYNGGELLVCADDSTPYFNYIDTGHILIYTSTGEHLGKDSRFFITDNLTLDMNYIIAAAGIYPPAIDAVLQNKAFLPSKDCRLTLLKVEKLIPPKLRAKYLEVKQRIQDDFIKNTANVMIGKLSRKESPFIELNGIRITSTRADYTAGHVSIEAPNLAEVIFAKLDPSEAEWDIFTLINIYTDWVNEAFKDLPLNTAGTGFAAAKTFKFSINDIPLKVSCNTENTRRSINDCLINVDELSPALKRASCYQVPEDETEEDNIKNFNKFLSNVSRYSLKIRDIWANGLPVKTAFILGDQNVYDKPATSRHPKLRFILKDKKGFYLQVNETDPKDKKKILKVNEYHVGKFAEFIKKVETLNKHTSMGYSGNYSLSSENIFISNSGNETNRCVIHLPDLLKEYATGITEDDLKNVIGKINYELSEAEKRSVELLKEACELTKSKPGTRDGKKGYVVPGEMRTYFVEEDAPFKTWNNDPKASNPYFCIVNKGDMGVGKDALVARLFALHNDKMMVKQIHTLK